ncbi:unnamed protein product [Orchesella dallaii]|uniref:F-box domain-containing protein n=1 Tax=Orchesella dallaii TaxID=48710 RepID=A0ABP1RIU0_9HEXA
METQSKKIFPQSAGNSLTYKSPQMRDLPLEIMERIIENLNENGKDLMNYRLVSSNFASAVDYYIERKIRSNWTRWSNGLEGIGEFSQSYKMANQPPVPFPVFYLVPTTILPNDRSPSAYYPEGLLKHSRNPFPTQSITILFPNDICFPHDSFETQEKLRKLNYVKVDKLLLSFGLHLTTFIFQDTIVTFPFMESIMESLANLRAITLSKIKLRESSKKLIGSQTSLISSQLTHIRAVISVAPEVIQWLVDRCAYQLVSLDVYASGLRPFKRPPNTSSSPVPYNELKFLKLYNPTLTFLQLTEEFPVKYLSFILVDNGQEQQVSARDIKNFIGKFSKTLIELNLQLNWENARLNWQAWKEDETEDEFLKRLPKLVNFGIRGYEGSRIDRILWEYFMLERCNPRFKFYKIGRVAWDVIYTVTLDVK